MNAYTRAELHGSGMGQLGGQLQLARSAAAHPPSMPAPLEAATALHGVKGASHACDSSLESSLAAGSWGHEFWCSALPIAAELIAVRQSAAEYK